MRVVHISAFRQFVSSDGITFGGLERLLSELVPAQRALGIDVDMLDMTAEALDGAAAAIAGRDWARLRGQFENVLARPRADIVHVHDWYGALAMEALYREGHRAIVMTSHLPLRRGFTYRDVGLGWERKLQVEDRALRAARRVVAPSGYVRAFLAEEYGLPAERLRTIPHGVDADAFDREAGRRGRDGVRLLAVGRFTEQKGFELLVRALPTVLRSSPRAHLTIVGDGERRAPLARLIDHLGLASHVTIVPTASKAALAGHYSEATLLVMPSLFEPFGLVGLEAMACGCPVFAIEPTGAAEYLLPEEMTPAHAPARLGHAILRRLDHVHAQRDVAAEMRRRAGQFTWVRAAMAHAALYRECIG